jgi:Uma2 family endonuclease
MVRLDATPSFASQNDPVNEDIPDDILMPPTNLESDEPPLETDLHRDQIDLLIRILKYWWQDRPDFYISGNLTVYYNQEQLKSRDFRGPDVFVVLGTEKRDRRSWAIWEEGGKYPNVVIELLSNSTATVDRGLKKDLYRDVWRVLDYFWFHPETLEFAGFHLMNGAYQAITPTDTGWLWSEQLGLYLGIHDRQLRWFSAEGQLIPRPEDQERWAKEQAQQAAAQAQQVAEQAQQAAEQERQAKEQAQQRTQRLEDLLRSRGIDPDQL